MSKASRKFVAVLIILILTWFSWKKSDYITFHLWHLFSPNKINVGILSINIPENWVVKKEKTAVVIIRRPDGSGSISIGYNSISKQQVETKSFTAENGKILKYAQFKEIKIGEYEGFIASVNIDNDRIDAVFSFPEYKLRGYFLGSKSAYSEFLQILDSAKPRKW